MLRLLLAGLFAVACFPHFGSADLVNRWSFNNAQNNNVTNGTTLTDSVSGVTATVRGNYARFTGTSLTLRGPAGGGGQTATTNGQQTSASMSGYVDLPNGIISSKTNLSVEIWATPHSA